MADNAWSDFPVKGVARQTLKYAQPYLSACRLQPRRPDLKALSSLPIVQIGVAALWFSRCQLQGEVASIMAASVVLLLYWKVRRSRPKTYNSDLTHGQSNCIVDMVS